MYASEFMYVYICMYLHLLFVIPYVPKHLRGKPFVFRMENCYLLESFCVSMLVDIHCQLTRP